MDARFVFLPRPAKGLLFEKSQFKASYGKTLLDLERELAHLWARDVVIQAGFPPDRIRLDGWPYSSARPEHPGVLLQFRSKGEVLTFRAFRFRSFEENLRAIALTMDALRRVDRYGVVEGEQYAGFKRLTAPEAEVLKNAAWAAAYLSSLGAIQISHVNTNRAALDLAYRAAVKKAHPDAGGDHETFLLVQEAYHLLLRGVAA